MINVRSNVFETNSSSSHTISLTFSDKNLKEIRSLDDTLVLNKQNELIIVGEDFTGIEFIISGAKSKAALIATYILVHDDNKLRDRFEAVLKSRTYATSISYDIRFVAQDGEPANAFYCPDIEDACWYNQKYDEERSFIDILKSKKRIEVFIFDKNAQIEGGEIYD